VGGTGDSPVVSGDSPETLPSPVLPTFSPTFNRTQQPRAPGSFELAQTEITENRQTRKSSALQYVRIAHSCHDFFHGLQGFKKL
jgi:hypothetical protein